MSIGTLTRPTYSYQESLDLLVEKSIEKNELHRDLGRVCKALGISYNEVAEHIASEIEANRG